MDTIKLEAKWPPDRKSAIDASEFGIYKEPTDGKRLRGTDRATGCLLVLSLVAAIAVVLYFAFYNYTIPTTQAAAAGPITSYAKYVKEKQTTADRSADGLLAAVLGVKNAENFTTSPATADRAVTTAGERIDRAVTTAGERIDRAYGRQMRLYPLIARHGRPVAYAPYGRPMRWKTDAIMNDGGSKLEYSDGLYGFSRRSDFPQLAAYRAPFPPKSILDVMKYVTAGSSRPAAAANVPEYMTAQESRLRYVPIRPAEEVNKFLPDVNAPSGGGGNSKRFRNKFGPPVFMTPPMMAFPDDFMKPPSPDARYSMDFDSDVSVDLTLQEGSASVPSHTDVVFHSPSTTLQGYPVPDAPTVPKQVNGKRIKNKKPISVMLDIYPLSDGDHENDQVEDNEEFHKITAGMIDSLKNNNQQSDGDNVFFRLNLFPKFSDGGRRLAKNLKIEEQKNQDPIHFTTQNPLQDETYLGSGEDEKLFDYNYESESKNIAKISKVQ